VGPTLPGRPSDARNQISLSPAFGRSLPFGHIGTPAGLQLNVRPPPLLVGLSVGRTGLGQGARGDAVIERCAIFWMIGDIVYPDRGGIRSVWRGNMAASAVSRTIAEERGACPLLCRRGRRRKVSAYWEIDLKIAFKKLVGYAPHAKFSRPHLNLTEKSG